MEKEIEFNIVREGICQLKVCCNIPPEEIELNRLKIEALMPTTGVSHNWTLDLSQGVLKCAELPNRWHYILIC